MGGEDFSWYLEEIPGSMARLGVRIPGTDLDLHAASFDVDERAIAVGVRILVETAVQALDHYGAGTEPQGSRLRAVPPGRVGVGR
jgi:metal-dependent amidase/aminoacylase/carboxypeptidase family protein